MSKNHQIIYANIDLLETIIGPIEDSKIPLDEKRDQIEQWVVKQKKILTEDDINQAIDNFRREEDGLLSSQSTLIDENSPSSSPKSTASQKAITKQLSR